MVVEILDILETPVRYNVLRIVNKDAVTFTRVIALDVYPDIGDQVVIRFVKNKCTVWSVLIAVEVVKITKLATMSTALVFEDVK